MPQSCSRAENQRLAYLSFITDDTAFYSGCTDTGAQFPHNITSSVSFRYFNNAHYLPLSEYFSPIPGECYDNLK